MRVFQRIFHLAMVCSLIGLYPVMSLAQETGAIKGAVKDVETGKGLAEVNVVLSGTSRGANTAADGSFSITSVKPGEYELIVSLIGYATLRQRLVVTAGSETTLALELQQKPLDLSEILVQADRPYSAASSRAVRDFDLRVRPNRSAQELLQTAPGLIIAQHAGGGKAEQIFLRGFDADHGTDVNISVDGMPVNMVSHGHGQGYADLHFIIPEVIDALEVYKGPYFAEFGDLATAGAVAMRTRDHVESNLVRLEGGQFETYRLTTLYQIPGTGIHNNAYLAGQFYGTDGPVDSPQGFRRVNLFGKFHTHLNETSKLSLDIGGFSSAWNASGQIPWRAVRSGLIDRFGAIDDFEGGTTGRQNLNLAYEAHGEGNSEFLIRAYTTRYNFKLFSNFTFFLNDPVNGDMIEQTDSRTLLGLNSRHRFHHQIGGLLATATLGGGYRADDIAVALWRSPGRVRDQALVNSDIFQRNLYLWAQEELILGPMVRLQLGLRGDYFTYDVEDHLEGTPSDLPHASGFAQKTILSPKANLVISPAQALELFVNFGTGFHSNDARDVVIARRVSDAIRRYRQQGLSEEEIAARLAQANFDPAMGSEETLPRATGGEIGFRMRLGNRLNFGAALWGLNLEREFVYVGDEGTTELSGRTQRHGLDLEARCGLTSWLYADVDLNLSRGKLRDAPAEADEIPLAPRLSSAGGLTVKHPSGLEGGLRYRHIGDRPANEANTVTALGYSVLDLTAGYRFGNYQLHFILENLTDTDWNEAQFDTESRLPNETEPVSELHFTPGNPRNVRVGLSYFF
ncbi:MAG: TonB-dependent receptor [candidate division KSB1 bacterium]|nr:TonB-dependent receptor [candidate division KSB1 bacterium]MDZ7274474.1 TonB-dependent receptor [candidate division KSB1 bacterium]MDZ7284864.1 TonB-dependent receptor [candidate division KSB1 bacterium]MDZ7297716.1 TonB-dependent receptor [candidate division KSB1 bacterium]MDZ7348582.1 TonB-dependent receptor [candidate division KSB1 bacterium]